MRCVADGQELLGQICVAYEGALTRCQPFAVTVSADVRGWSNGIGSETL